MKKVLVFFSITVTSASFRIVLRAPPTFRLRFRWRFVAWEGRGCTWLRWSRLQLPFSAKTGMVLLYEKTNTLTPISVRTSTLLFTESQIFFKNPCFPLISLVNQRFHVRGSWYGILWFTKEIKGKQGFLTKIGYSVKNNVEVLIENGVRVFVYS